MSKFNAPEPGKFNEARTDAYGPFKLAGVLGEEKEARLTELASDLALKTGLSYEDAARQIVAVLALQPVSRLTFWQRVSYVPLKPFRWIKRTFSDLKKWYHREYLDTRYSLISNDCCTYTDLRVVKIKAIRGKHRYSLDFYDECYDFIEVNNGMFRPLEVCKPLGWLDANCEGFEIGFYLPRTSVGDSDYQDALASLELWLGTLDHEGN